VDIDYTVRAITLPPEKISLMEVMKVFQKPIRLNECKFKKSDCPEIENCSLKKIVEIEKEVMVKLKAITIESIIKKEVNVND
jgi:DNA-binding IscR family transcriptional regulator